jgi:hypothetical protein
MRPLRSQQLAHHPLRTPNISKRLDYELKIVQRTDTSRPTGSCTHGWRLALLRTGSARVAADWYSQKRTKPHAMGNERQEILFAGITDAAFQKLNLSDAEYPAVVSFLIGHCLTLLKSTSESDVEAYHNRHKLLYLTSALLENNLDLARRIAGLETSFNIMLPEVNERPESLARTIAATQNGASFTNPDTYNSIYAQSYGTASSLQFQKVLLSSKVYRKAKALSSDVSFRSSIGLSHAWTALSALSLSEISNVSLVALPLFTTDLGNCQHYTFPAEPNWKDCSGFTIVVKGSHNASPHEIVEKV